MKPPREAAEPATTTQLPEGSLSFQM